MPYYVVCNLLLFLEAFILNNLEALPNSTDHGLVSEEEADTFLTDIPVLGERDEPEGNVSHQMLTEQQSDLGNLVHFTTNPDLAWCQLLLSLN